MSHEPVLLHEVIAGLDLRSGLTVLDATLGSGGHGRAIGEVIGATGRLIGLDADPAVIIEAKASLADLPCQVILHHGNFRDLDFHLETLGINVVDRALFDLGLSSPQLIDPTRGFSFQTDGPLLMTLAGADTGGLNAARLINELSVLELSNILARYGEERHARRIAEAIVAVRRVKAILTTGQLVEIIATAVPKNYRFARRHFATKTFQALRIATNNELEALALGRTTNHQAGDSPESRGDNQKPSFSERHPSNHMQNKTHFFPHREWQTMILLGLVALLIVSYIFLVNRVIFHAAGKQVASREIAALTSEVSLLETRSLTLEDRITLDLASEYGFLETAPLLVSWRSYGRE